MAENHCFQCFYCFCLSNYENVLRMLQLVFLHWYQPWRLYINRQLANATDLTGIWNKEKTIKWGGEINMGSSCLYFCCHSGLPLLLVLIPALPSHTTCIIAFPLRWTWGKWSYPNVTVVILIDGVDTYKVPEHWASPHRAMTNFIEQIAMAW